VAREKGPLPSLQIEQEDDEYEDLDAMDGQIAVLNAQAASSFAMPMADGSSDEMVMEEVTDGWRSQDLHSTAPLKYIQLQAEIVCWYYLITLIT
jgi:hypothetical protein